MKKIPKDENDLIPVAIYWSMTEKFAVDKAVNLSEIKLFALRLIYGGQPDKARVEIARLCRENNWENNF